MSACLSDYQCLVPSTVEEALQQRAANPGLMPVAGGTDVMVWFNDGKAPGKVYQSLHRLADEWRYVQHDGRGLHIGPLATYTDVRHHAAVAEQYPLLVESARVTGALQIQNRGTLAGNIANGSPAADTVPVLMTYDAELEIISLSGKRSVALSEFYTGYRKNVLRDDELIGAIHLPVPLFSKEQVYYRKVGTREAQAISKVCLSAARNGNQVRLAWGSVAPTTVRSVRTEQAIAEGASFDAAWEILQQEISPIDDIRSTREYRLEVSGNLLRDFMAKHKG